MRKLKVVLGMFVLYLLIQIVLLTSLLSSTDLQNANLLIRSLVMVGSYAVSVLVVWFVFRKVVSLGIALCSGIIPLGLYVVVVGILDEAIELYDIVLIFSLLYASYLYSTLLNKEGV